jgi:dihydrodipicolinate synthase/N-acetylneuraminate lyase
VKNTNPSTQPKRYPAVIMGTCLVPWTEKFQFDEPKFRLQVRDLAQNLTSHLYIFGTAGEGYAVSDSQFETITRSFLEEAANSKVQPTVGIISLSLPTILDRIERARNWGANRFQISLPSWGGLNDRELGNFFRETCGRFEDCEFMHYNLMRTKRLLTPAEYGRLAGEYPNFVATKNTKNDEAFLLDLFTRAPQMQHFLGEAGYATMRERFECGLLISVASTNPARAKKFFAARGSELQHLSQEIFQARAALIEALKATIGEGPYIDGAYDKLIFKLRAPDFPLRLMPPYEAADDAPALKQYREAMTRLAPLWLPEGLSSSTPAPGEMAS